MSLFIFENKFNFLIVHSLKKKKKNPGLTYLVKQLEKLHVRGFQEIRSYVYVSCCGEYISHK